jgi:transposase-like protein
MKNFNAQNQETQAIFEKIISNKEDFFKSARGDVQSFLIQGMSDLLNRAFLKDREFYLEENCSDKANGFASTRNVNFGINQVPISVPRARNGNFYPSLLPKYGRNIGDAYGSLLESIILNCKSFKSIANTFRSFDLPYSQAQTEIILDELFAEAKKYNSRQLESDYVFIYIDAKVIDVTDETGHVKKAVHFLALGVNMEMKKEILLSESFFGNECLDLWRKVLQNLKNRGVTRVLMLITDDFSGLNKMINSLFPNSDHQLCLVHLLRNAKKNFDQKTYEEFKQLLDSLYNLGSPQDAYSSFKLFLNDNLKNYSSYAKYLEERTNNYLAFAKYPKNIRPMIRSTNAVEGINNAVEIARRTSGGYFHSEREIAVKLKIVFDNLMVGKWRNPVPKFKACLCEISQMFFERFE